MARWFVSRIVGTGTEGDSFRAKVADLPAVTSYVAQIPSNPDGTPRRGWALCHVEATDYPAVAADPDVFSLPNLLKDQTLSSLTAAQRNAIRTKVQQVWGVDPTATAGTTFRALLRQIGRIDEGWFHEDDFGVR